MDQRPHSAGGVYISFNKLHRSVQLLDFNIHLLMVLLGELSLENLNHVFAPFIPELKMPYIGLFFHYSCSTSLTYFRCHYANL